MPAAYPRLRDDLPITCQETADGHCFVIKDPQSGRFFRLRETEYFIASRLDGTTAPEVVRQKVEKQIGAAVGADTLEQFIGQLRQLDLLEDGRTPGRSPGSGRILRGHLLYLRVRAFDPDRLFDKIVPRLWFFFTPAFLVLSASVILLAFAITLTNWSEIALHISRLYRFDALLLAWATVLAITTVHEFAHGVTCKHFGGEVHDIGFLLLYFQPAFYCNVSDAWLFPQKSHRLWVTFAGGYFEAFLSALATVAWRLTEPDTWVNFVALVVAASSGIKFAFNANPLIKLDGYYLLSDYLEVPNLRQRSLSYLGGWLRRARPTTVEPTPRERRIYLVYGVMAAAYTGWILALILWHFGSFLLGRYQGIGLIVFVAFVAAVFQRPLGRMLARLRRIVGRQRGESGNVARFKRPGRYVLPAAGALAILTFAKLELKVAGDFKILPAHNADVRAQVEGIIAEVYVDEGDSVARGQVLVSLSDREQRSQLATIEAAIEEKRARLRMLQAGPTHEEIELARAELATASTKKIHVEKRYNEAIRLQAARLSRAETALRSAQERLDYTKKDLDRFNELFRVGLVPRSQLEDREQQMHLREREQEQARDELTLASIGDAAQVGQELAVVSKEAEQASGRLNLVMAGSRTELMQATEAEVAQLQSRRQFLKDQLALLTVASPASGVIVTPRLKETTGRHINAGDLIVEVYELTSVSPELFVSEKDVADVQRGQAVALKARAYPEKTFTGTVASIAPAAMQAGDLGAKGFRVRVNLNSDSELLKPEMTGMAKISCGKRGLGSLLTRRIARVLRVEFWSWW